LTVINSSVPRRYARALFQLAQEDGQHENVGAQLEAVASVVRGTAEARTLVANPGYTPAQRHALVDLLAQHLSLQPVTVSFLHLLVERHRMAEIQAIALAYREMVDEKLGRVRATVTSVTPLPPDELGRIRDALSAATRRTILLESRTDPEIVGGLVAQVGPTVWDGSLKTQLERLRRELKSGAL
jgi:F-type H+-transporting ATPase subunit delta